MTDNQAAVAFTRTGAGSPGLGPLPWLPSCPLPPRIRLWDPPADGGSVGTRQPLHREVPGLTPTRNPLAFHGFLGSPNANSRREAPQRTSALARAAQIPGAAELETRSSMRFIFFRANDTFTGEAFRQHLVSSWGSEPCTEAGGGSGGFVHPH